MLAYNLMLWPDSKHKLLCHAGEWPPGNQRRGKKITCFVLKQQMGERVDFTTKSSKVALFFFPNIYFPAFMGRMLQAQGNAAATPPFLTPNFCFRKCNYEAHEGIRADTHFRWKEKRAYQNFSLKIPPLLKRIGRIGTHHTL